MKAQAFFSNSTGLMRLVVTDRDGNLLYEKRFDRCSSMVNHCDEHGITLTIDDCFTED
ncbi:MAG: hypothetical protein IJ760_00995 [Bacteroidales bacterium]|nr:hypothetical protein [Bacteroidales bacterium]